MGKFFPFKVDVFSEVAGVHKSKQKVAKFVSFAANLPSISKPLNFLKQQIQFNQVAIKTRLHSKVVEVRFIHSIAMLKLVLYI